MNTGKHLSTEIESVSTETMPFLPDAKGLSNPSEVELLRERVYASLEAYCKQKYPDQQGRYATKHKRTQEGQTYRCFYPLC